MTRGLLLTRLRFVGCLIAALVVGAPSARAQSSPDVFNLTLDELLNMKVTSVSRKVQPLAEAAAAVFVLNQEDIRRSGASSLPELLRMVPGVQVARYSNSKWSISARGMGGYYSSKLLVLVDGRSVYTPNFSGVYWDVQDFPLDTIDRVEVIRGPGGTMWGANAVNGVINIITKSAADTQGVLAVAGSGTEDRGLLSLRYGGWLGERTAYRVYAKASERVLDTLGTVDDNSQIIRTGFRIDHDGGTNSATLQGDVYSGNQDTPLAVPQVAAPYLLRLTDSEDVNGANVVGRWTRTLSPTSNFVVKAYFDHSVRDQYIHHLTTDAVDVDAQHSMRLGERHDLMWGGEFRSTLADITTGSLVQYNPGRIRRHLFSAFAQDEIALSSKVALTVGSKVEHHENVGVAVEPSVRAMWKIAPQQHLWGAVSRSARTPSLGDQVANFIFDVLPPSPATKNLPVEVHVLGDIDVKLEQILAYEVGYRTQPSSTIAFDFTGFRNHYSDLTSYARRPATFSVAGGLPHLVLESVHQNHVAGNTYGLEMAATWTPTSRLSIVGGATLLNQDLFMDDPALDPGRSLLVLELNPTQQFTLGSLLQLTHTIDVGATVYKVGAWKMGDVAGYTRTDVRGGWKLTGATSLDAGVQNLFDDRHAEANLYFYQQGAQIPRSAYVRLSVGF